MGSGTGKIGGQQIWGCSRGRAGVDFFASTAQIGNRGSYGELLEMLLYVVFSHFQFLM